MNATRSCSVEGCTRRYRSGGYCQIHLDESRARGELKDLRYSENRPALKDIPCRIKGCGSISKYRGQKLCMKHYLRRFNHGSFTLPDKPSLADRLEDGISSKDGCWIWGGTIASMGYGKIGSLYAHRVSYEVHKGPIPDGLQIDHLCRVRACVNPNHLEAVTQDENLRRQRLFMARRQDGTWERAS